ncbi:MAG: HPF/RaiA family ribosome-associated protein [Phycisphaerae bacterium]
MQININSDNHIDMDERTLLFWQDEIGTALNRFESWVTRLEVHLTDENSEAKGGDDDIRCLIEARPKSHQPVSVDVRAATVEQALKEGIRTIERRLGSMADKSRTEKRKPHV